MPSRNGHVWVCITKHSFVREAYNKFSRKLKKKVQYYVVSFIKSVSLYMLLQPNLNSLSHVFEVLFWNSNACVGGLTVSYIENITESIITDLKKQLKLCEKGPLFLKNVHQASMCWIQHCHWRHSPPHFQHVLIVYYLGRGYRVLDLICWMEN